MWQLRHVPPTCCGKEYCICYRPGFDLHCAAKIILHEYTLILTPAFTTFETLSNLIS